MQNLGQTKESINMMSIPEIEGILEGVAQNNSSEDKDREVLEDGEALKYLMKHQGSV